LIHYRGPICWVRLGGQLGVFSLQGSKGGAPILFQSPTARVVWKINTKSDVA